MKQLKKVRQVLLVFWRNDTTHCTVTGKTPDDPDAFNRNEHAEGPRRMKHRKEHILW